MNSLNSLAKRLTQYEEQESRSIVRLLLFDVFGLTLTDICCGALDALSPEQAERLERLMQRLEAGEPLQYVTGKADFAGRSFHVEPGVLIPRPETEDLCGLVVSAMVSQTLGQKEEGQRGEGQGEEKPLKILDIGTGSGCIAVTLALALPHSCVSAWDVSPTALSIARGNAERLGASVDIMQQDALHAPADEGCWDVIVSNPPYICHKEKAAMEPHVLDHEPHLALFVPDEEPLLFYLAIAQYACRALKPQGLLAFEINPEYAEMTAEMLRGLNYDNITIHDDQFGKHRFITSKLRVENPERGDYETLAVSRSVMSGSTKLIEN